MAYELYKVKTADGKVYKLEYHGPSHGRERWYLTIGKGIARVESFAGKGVFRPGFLHHQNVRVGAYINCRSLTTQIVGLWRGTKGRLFMGWKRIQSADQV